MRDYAVAEQPAGLPPEYEQEVPATSSSKRRRRFGHLSEWLIVLLTLFVLLVAIGTLAVLLSERDFTGRIYPHISVRGLNLGGYSVSSAHSALERHYVEFLQNPVEVVYGDRRWYPTAAQLGIQLDFDTALQTAVAIGRTGSRVDNVQTVAAVWDQGVEIPLHMRVDQAVMQQYLLELARSVEAPPQNADVILQGSQVITNTEFPGIQVLVDETLYDMTVAVQDLRPAQVTLRTSMLQPSIYYTDIEPYVADIEDLLSTPIYLTATSGECIDPCTWKWDREQLASWVHLDHSTDVEGRPVIRPIIDQSAMRNALIPIAAALREEGTLPRVDWNNGQLLISESGLPGRGLDANLALAQINESLAGTERTLELPLTAIPPPITQANLSGLGITTQLGVGVSSFRASEGYRITNIRAGSRRMHGLLLPPDAAFSFNDTLGAVDGRNGFVQGLAIVNNRTQKEWGGGLCQVSTTMFRAAFWTGLPIVERHEHSFRIPWYEELGEPPGLDAAIYTGANDLRFVNDTGGWLLLQSWVDLNQQRLVMAIYGPPVQRDVSMSYAILERTARPTKPVYVNDPSLSAGYFRQTDYAQGGLTSEVYRVVRQGDVIVYQDTFRTTFQPWPDIYVRGTGGR